MDSPTSLRSAIALARAGDRIGARRLLAQIVRSEPANETAWLWLADTFETPVERARALETCLRYLPHSQPAQSALARLRQPMSDRIPTGSPSPSPAATAAPQAEGSGAQEARKAAQAQPSAAAHRRSRISGAQILLLAFWIIVFVGAIALAVQWLTSAPQGNASPDTLRPKSDPVQTTINQAQTQEMTHPDWGYTWVIQPRARYHVTARVLGVTRYYFDIRSRLAPYDFALGWGEMSEPKVDQWIDWSQSGRWYYYTWSDDSPYSVKDIRDHSSNHHHIPATDNLRAALGLVRVNDILYLEGLLVDTKTSLGSFQFYAATSLSRSDSGDSACEVLWVERLIHGGVEYR